MDIRKSIESALDFAEKTENTELAQKISYIQKAYTALLDENDALKARINSSESSAYAQDELILRGDCYYIRSSGGQLDGPYCPACLDKDEELNKMQIRNCSKNKLAVCNICYYQTINF